MTKRFRLGLFMALAAAVGLHLRPCLGCLVAASIETVASGVSFGVSPALSGAAALDGQGVALVRGAATQVAVTRPAVVLGQRPHRPSMTAVTAVPGARLQRASFQRASLKPASFQRALIRDNGIAR